jgi:hypothetical protein
MFGEYGNKVESLLIMTNPALWSRNMRQMKRQIGNYRSEDPGATETGQGNKSE